MIITEKIVKIKEYLEENKNIEYRIINNTLGKNLILINGENTKTVSKNLLKDYEEYIQEIIIEAKEEDNFIIDEIKKICPKNSVVHRNVSYLNWNREVDKKFYNIIAGYSFKGGFNSEEQNEDGLRVILNLFDNFNDSFIMNSTIRYPLPTERDRKEKELKEFLLNHFKLLNENNIIHIEYKAEMLEGNIEEFKSFIQNQKKLYNVNNDVYLQETIEIINTKYFNKRDILLKLEKVFFKLGEVRATKKNLSELIIKKMKESLTDEELFKIKIFNEKDDNEAIKLLFSRDISWIIEKFEEYKIPLKDIYKFIYINLKHEKSDLNADYLFSLIASSNYHNWNKIFEELKSVRHYRT